MEDVMFFETIIQPKGNVYIFPIIFIVFMIIIALLVIGLMGGIISASKNTNISINNNDVVINSFMYGRKIPIENVLVNEIKAINLSENKEFAVSYKTNGINVPKLTSGWVKLKNGKKALVFITDQEKVLLMPTKDYIVLFSMENISEFIKKLQTQKQ